MTSSHAHRDMAPGFEGPQTLPDMPKFTTNELQAMHRYCLKYRDLVRSGETPTDTQSLKFLRFQTICYAEGIACARCC